MNIGIPVGGGRAADVKLKSEISPKLFRLSSGKNFGAKSGYLQFVFSVQAILAGWKSDCMQASFQDPQLGIYKRREVNIEVEREISWFCFKIKVFWRMYKGCPAFYEQKNFCTFMKRFSLYVLKIFFFFLIHQQCF